MVIMKIEINENLGNVTAIDVLTDKGFEYVGKIDIYYDALPFRATKSMHNKPYFIKDNEYYVFVNWTYFNSFVEEINIKKVS